MMLVMMKPQDFLDLAAPALEWADEGMATDEWMKENIREGRTMQIPNLKLDDWTELGQPCRVTEHEGRHRAKAARDLGIDRIPVAIQVTKRMKEKMDGWNDRDVWRHPPVDDLGCFPCKMADDDKEICTGEVQAQRGIYVLGTEGSLGPVRDVEFERLKIDWCRVPDVKNATERWREEHGIVLDCE